MKFEFSNPVSRKLLVAIVASLFGVLMLPHGLGAAVSIYVFPSVAAGIAFGVALMQLLSLSTIWKKAEEESAATKEAVQS